MAKQKELNTKQRSMIRKLYNKKDKVLYLEQTHEQLKRIEKMTQKEKQKAINNKWSFVIKMVESGIPKNRIAEELGIKGQALHSIIKNFKK